ncbi:MAG: hypothetical protein HGA93_03730 [Methanothrix sp.]|nr:hypothetical protein [Methanothrix sp.]
MIMREYKEKCVSADEAVQVIRSGDWVEFGFAASMPLLLDKALARRKEELWNVNLRGGILLSPLDMLECDPKGEHFIWNSWHLGGRERRLAEKGVAYYIPLKYSECPRYIRENLHTDVAIIQVSPMDKHGYFNFGVTISHYANVRGYKFLPSHTLLFFFVIMFVLPETETSHMSGVASDPCHYYTIYSADETRSFQYSPLSSIQYPPATT